MFVWKRLGAGQRENDVGAIARRSSQRSPAPAACIEQCLADVARAAHQKYLHDSKALRNAVRTQRRFAATRSKNAETSAFGERSNHSNCSRRYGS
ncbi:hypothetical protein BMA10229_A1070 [Burkholderia mallei NCTC 10229]|uniref:Uncharacterized protein n=1 Tax=Burkholderia mallei (strain NCTC 10229) TaxID=412022 RepID=A2S536_BURM9|nr:hypothetical protein BMA10229_A1070 [Burkholderia mallei NCTC 10229]